MKRAGKVFLALALVLAMLWTSTGTSNVPGVLAENVASMQSAKDNKEAVKATTEETTMETKEKSTTASKAEQETTAKKEETTTQEAATEAETKKEEAATREKKAESTTAAKKKTAKSKIATQDAAEAATKGSDSNSSNQNIARAAKIDIAKCITAVDMSVTINGKNYTVAHNGQAATLYDANGAQVTAIDGAMVTVTATSINLKQVYTVTAGVVGNLANNNVGQIDVSNGVSTPNSYQHGSANLTYADSITLQVGARSKDAVDFNFSYVTSGIGELKADLDISARGLGTDQLSLATQEDANAAIDKIDNAINKTSMVRATFGSIQNRMEHKIENLTTTNENLTDAESTIRDTDMASEMLNYTKYNILQQAAQSMLAQANQQPQSVLQLLG